jgi:hypothetical protein
LVAPISGVGGGVLFVPLATVFFPFNIDFIRGTGIVMALVSAQSSAPHLIKNGLANLRVMAPVAVVSIITSMIGSLCGIWLTNAFPSGEHYVTIALGVLLFGIFVVMVRSSNAKYPKVEEAGTVASALKLCGVWYEHDIGRMVEYKCTNLRWGLLCFAGVGFVAGMFGVGAGWASVPVLNLIMGVPIKVAAATSMGIITVNGAAATWIYLANGAILPFIVVPSVIGVTIGARIGARVAHRAKPVYAKYLVLGVMLFAGAMNIYKGCSNLNLF